MHFTSQLETLLLKQMGVSGSILVPILKLSPSTADSFSGLCSGKSSCGYPGNVYRLQASVRDKQLFKPTR